MTRATPTIVSSSSPSWCRWRWWACPTPGVHLDRTVGQTLRPASNNGLVWRTAAVSALAGLLICATAAASTPSPRAMVLALADMPSGYKMTNESGWRSNARAAKESKNTTLAQFQNWGRIIGYEADFSRDVSIVSAMTGAVDVESVANVYKTSGGAHSSFADNVKHCNTKPFSPLSLSERIGDEAVLCVAVVKSKGNPDAKAFGLIWRHGSVLAGIIAVGLDGGIAPEEAVALAVKQDKHI